MVSGDGWEKLGLDRLGIVPELELTLPDFPAVPRSQERDLELPPQVFYVMLPAVVAPQLSVEPGDHREPSGPEANSAADFVADEQSFPRHNCSSLSARFSASEVGVVALFSCKRSVSSVLMSICSTGPLILQ